jgi:hypothetical protein
VAEGGGLLNRYTVNPVSWVRIPSPPPLPWENRVISAAFPIYIQDDIQDRSDWNGRLWHHKTRSRRERDTNVGSAYRVRGCWVGDHASGERAASSSMLSLSTSTALYMRRGLCRALVRSAGHSSPPRGAWVITVRHAPAVLGANFTPWSLAASSGGFPERLILGGFGRQSATFSSRICTRMTRCA